LIEYFLLLLKVNIQLFFPDVTKLLILHKIPSHIDIRLLLRAFSSSQNKML